MRTRFGGLTRRWASLLVPLLIAVLIGVAVAIASSPASLTRDRGAGANSAATKPSPSPAGSSPVPSVTSPGALGDSAHLVAGGSGVLIALASNLAEASSDGGKTWSTLRPPKDSTGLAVDPADPRRAITGGSSIQVTVDGGGSWKASRTAPPGTGPFQPLLVSPFDNAVWFLIHEQRLLRTRDAAVSWRDLTLIPLATPVMVPGTVFGQFFLASGSRVFELIDNGQRIVELPPLPQGVTVTDLAVVAGDPPSLLVRNGTANAYFLKGDAWSVVAGGGLKGPVGVGANGVLLVGNDGAKLGSPGALSYSTDAGFTWAMATGLPYDESVEAITGQISSSTPFAYCYGGDIYTSADGGRSWTRVTRALRTTGG